MQSHDKVLTDIFLVKCCLRRDIPTITMMHGYDTTNLKYSKYELDMTENDKSQIRFSPVRVP